MGITAFAAPPRSPYISQAGVGPTSHFSEVAFHIHHLPSAIRAISRCSLRKLLIELHKCNDRYSFEIADSSPLVVGVSGWLKIDGELWRFSSCGG